MSSPLVLLDTHCWVWIQAGAKNRLPPKMIRGIQRAAAVGNLLLSVISVWEVGILESKGKIRFGMPCEQWVKEALATPGMMLAPLTPEIALASSRLPGSFHGDPADRILVATARNMGAKIATVDERVLDYAAHHHLGVV
jgi:PIN domain nuclease of toxin-antitoxin system